MAFRIEVNKLKQGRPGYKPNLWTFKEYSETALCVFTHLCECIKRTQPMRGEELQIFITSVKPHRPASRDTISRWVKRFVTSAGINTGIFKPGSTRSASSSNAAKSGVPLQEIFNVRGWSRETTFSKWYKRHISKIETRRKLLGIGWLCNKMRIHKLWCSVTYKILFFLRQWPWL